MDDPFWKKVAETIGEVCIWWADLEVLVQDVAFHLSILVTDAETESNFNTLNLILSTADIRQTIAIVKLLAHHVNSPRSPNFYDKVETLMNYLDNEARSERNRFVHDSWVKDREGVIRANLGPKVRRPQSHQRVIEWQVARPYKDLAAMQEFVKNLELACDDLAALDWHASDLSFAKGQPEEYVQPLPQEWQSLAHRDWQPPDKRGHQPRSSEG